MHNHQINNTQRSNQIDNWLHYLYPNSLDSDPAMANILREALIEQKENKFILLLQSAPLTKVRELKDQNDPLFNEYLVRLVERFPQYQGKI